MTFPKPHWVFLFFFAIAPVSLNWDKESPGLKLTARTPAEAGTSNDCMTMARDLFISKHYEINHEAALAEKKLLSYTNKFVIVQHPRMEWINRMRKSLHQSLRNWNNNRYPAFYLFNDEEIVPTAKKYFQSLERSITEQLPLTKEQTDNQALVNAWIKAFQDYQTDIDRLLEERISLQYNLSLLKKIKVKDEPRDIKLMIKRDGKMTEEIITLRKEDKNLGHLIAKLKSEIAALDGARLKNGKIKERIIRQAMLKDILTIVHRELEYSVKNTPDVAEGMTKELDKLESLIKQSDFQPTTYGIYRVENKIFMREVFALTKLDKLYEKVKDPVNTIKEVFASFIKSRTNSSAANGTVNEKEKIGIFKRVYNKITSITPKQAAYGSGSAAVLAYGYHQYFWVGKSEAVEEIRGGEEILEEAHAEQLERTIQEDVKKSEGHSEVIELSIDELTNEIVSPKLIK